MFRNKKIKKIKTSLPSTDEQLNELFMTMVNQINMIIYSHTYYFLFSTFSSCAVKGGNLRMIQIQFSYMS